MTRPLVWALGVLAVTGIAGIRAGDRLTRLARGDDPPATASTLAPTGEQVVTLNADLRGHYLAHPAVNGQTLRMLVDTGASLVAIAYDDAVKAGIRVSPANFTMPLQSANGLMLAAPVRIDELRLGGIAVRSVEAVVLPRGLNGTSLLGMSFLRRLRGFEIASGRLTLRS